MNFNFNNMREEQEASEDEDYYKILEVNRDVSSEEIKKAYRKLSMIHHPDKNGNSEESTIKFKLIASAYEVLGNPDKKKLYDMGIRGGNGSGSPFGDFEHVNPFDIFNMIFGSMGAAGPQPNHPQQNHPQQHHVHGGGFPPSFIRGGMGPIQINSMGGPMGMGLGGMGIHIINSSGGGVQNPMQNHPHHPHFHFLHQQQEQHQQPHFFYEAVPQNQHQKKCEREPVTKNIYITLDNAYFGIEQLSVNLTELNNGGADATIYVCIPPGVNDKEVLILSNVTLSSFNFSQVNIIVNIEEHSIFKRNGMDLILNKEISLKESLCGVEFTMKHINNKSFYLQHKDGTIIKHNTTKTIPGLGMIDKNKNCGNLIIIFQIIYPDKLTREQIDTLSTVL
jgi:curved DNA-binding protein CbpA